MQRVPAATMCLALVAALVAVPPVAHAQGMAELAGGWIVTSWTDADGKVNSAPQRGLFIFTATGQYSMMYVNTATERPKYAGTSQTDAEILAAYASFTANSGRYTVNGNQLTYEAFVAKDPNYMAGWNTATPANGVTVTFGIANGILTLKWGSGEGALSGRTATFRRPNPTPASRE